MLGYLSHVDTVLADAEDWSADPWGAEIRDGYLYGRGAVDMKDQTAAEAVAAVRLAKAGAKFAGTLKLISVADEETGGELGAKWITEQRPDLSRVDYLLNEGGGAVIPYGDRSLFGVCVAEKGTFRFNLSTTGKAAHASVPGLADNALLKLAPAITALGEAQPGFDLMEATTRAARGARRGPGRSRAARWRGSPRSSRGWRRSSTPRCASPSRPRSSPRARRSTSSRRARRSASTAASRPAWAPTPRSSGAREVVGENGFKIEFTEEVIGNRSPVDSKLMDAISGWVGETTGRRDRADRAARRSPTAAGSGPRSRTAWRTASSPSATRRSTRRGR